MLKIILILFTALSVCGCMISGHVNSDITGYSQSINEFNLNPSQSYEGKYSGLSNRSGRNYHQYCFKDVLIQGVNARNLLILIPINDNNSYEEAQLVESVDDLPYHAPAKLLLMSGYNQRPNNYLSNCPLDLSLYSNHVIIIQKQYPHVEINRIFATISKTDLDKADWQPITTEISIEWNVRNRKEVNRKKMKYFYTIPLDIITAPVQLFMILTWGMWEK